MKRFYKLTPQIVICLTLIFFMFSCNSEEISIMQDDSSVSLYEIIEANSSYSTAKAAPKKGSDPIAAIAIDNGSFTQLVAALMYVDEQLGAGLVDLFLNGKDQLTVFAPNDDAFNALYDALEITGITDLDAELVLSVLQYHVTTGRRASNSVVPKNGMRTIETLLPEATFNVYPDLSIMAIGNSANILAADISASNGIIHVIDTVILPIE
ncbi:fasciclin domain-containing protein [Aestuariibaculum lutulentum]|uniref:Fasciclin domain-containing protein n=1 Tax=Aestuariibaculum lutulentum TaxID=2920935 RepID=A0ABS9RLF7_9FLAO|nr:fasciclin domain-containing protein [Aestuariibaculum lutulentum]MCH4553785.1 fasciclin domain-containing protein [Aestuariibaculum lutulentum]